MMKLDTAIQRVFDKCNLIGEEVNIYSVMDQYKVIRELPDQEYEEVYEVIAKDLGFRW